MVISLNGKWQLKAADEEKIYDAVVPGCNYTDLMSNGVIEDPFYGSNEKDCYFVAQKDWVYFRKFELDEEALSSHKIVLSAEMLDTVCKIYINDSFVSECDNCFVSYEIDIKDFVKKGENEIKIIFRSPVNYVKEKCKGVAVPPNANGQNGVAYIRKPAYHFGWDWGPVLPPSGIEGDIAIVCKNYAEIKEFEISQKHNENGSVTVSAACDIAKLCDCELEAAITLTYPCGKQETITAEKAVFEIEKPELWWTYELSKKEKQPLYKLTCEVTQKGNVVCSSEKTIGLRTIELSREKDEFGHNFCFKLNGVSVFAKGADYIPGDNFITRQTEKEYKMLLEAMRFSNFNMLRVWGGGFYANETLLNLCDEAGILIWHDFQFACMPYPFFNKEFLQKVRQEVECNVKRIKSHACLALWCGNNEIETMAGGWMHLREYIAATKDFFYGTLKEWVEELDGVTAFIPGSPCGIGPGKETDSDRSGDTHIWSVWHGLADMNIYRKRYTRFCSEFGFESLPDIKTIEKFAEKKDYALDSEVFLSHQKCFTGNEKIIYYVNSYFGMPQKFEDFIYLSQITQAICIENASEHWRRNKGRCNGALYWQFNDCWPTCSWSSYDYYGNYKALQYFARRFNSPVSVFAEDTRSNIAVVAINDLNEEQTLTIRCDVFDFENGILCKKEKQLTLDANCKIKVFDIDLKEMAKRFDFRKTGIKIGAYKGEEAVFEKTVLLLKEKGLKMPKCNLEVTKSAQDDTVFVTVKADKFARFINLTCGADALHFSDNYFDLLPGESKTVELKAGSEADIQKLMESIEVSSFCDVEMRKMTAKEKQNQLKMLTSPITIGNMVWHRRKVN